MSAKKAVFRRVALRACPLCQGRSFDPVAEPFDDRYGFPGRFPVEACRGCGLGVLRTQVAPSSLGRLYQDYYHQGIQARPAARPSRSVWKGRAFFLRARLLRGAELWRWTRPGASVLDVGSGEGWPRPVLAALGADYTGLEWNRRDCERMRADGLKVIQGDLRSALKSKRRFDTVALSQVLEHLPDPVKGLRQAASLLNAQGRLLVACPNWGSAFRRPEAWLNYHVPYHLWHFDPRTLALAAEKAGLRVLRLWTLSPLSWLALRGCLAAAVEGEINPCFHGAPSLPRQLAQWPEALAADLQGRGDCVLAELA